MSGVIRKLAWLHIDDRRLLCARTAGRPLFYVPGGKPEAGESDVAALLREILEELQVSLIPSTVRQAGRFSAEADGNADKIVQIDAYYADYFGTIQPAGEIAEYRFLTGLDAALASPATQTILLRLKARKFID